MNEQVEMPNGHLGTQIDEIGGNCPVQATGLIDGEPFYFRARGSEWSLRIGSESKSTASFAVYGRDVVGTPRWEHEEEWGDGPFDAGWMPEEEARRMIEKGAALYRAAVTEPLSQVEFETK